jgi:hypothetical protein
MLSTCIDPMDYRLVALTLALNYGVSMECRSKSAGEALLQGFKNCSRIGKHVALGEGCLWVQATSPVTGESVDKGRQRS